LLLGYGLSGDGVQGASVGSGQSPAAGTAQGCPHSRIVRRRGGVTVWAEITDPRDRRGRHHSLVVILAQCPYPVQQPPVAGNTARLEYRTSTSGTEDEKWQHLSVSTDHDQTDGDGARWLDN
jgi:hypothetical protein